ncbi:ABC-three component system protein [Emergencia sp.]|uniref:ABC-three component system protein n=1 Tax=Emergencia sp. TaxID=1926557 RepID=UPI003AF16509
MEDKRKSYTDNEKLLLFNEVDGYCPLCNEKLTYFKNGKIYKLFEIAHIYPLNPTSEQKEELKESPRLDSDVNSLNNVLAVCPKCHTKFDNPRTKEEYMLWYELKKKLILEENLRDNYFFFNLEEEIKEILSKLDNDQLELQETPLSYNSLKIEEKTNDTLPSHVKRTIKHDVVDYFDYIKEILY